MAEKYGVFITYSHEDACYVSPIVQIIRAMRKDLVFQDTVDLKPGKLWECQIMQALKESEIVIVFWCEHSAVSTYVKKEYEIAIRENKDVIPLLLDDTKIDEDLSKFQWIDLRKVIFHAQVREAPKKINYPWGDNGELTRDTPFEIYLRVVNNNAQIIASEILRNLDLKLPLPLL